jgi:copper(I)-binding protein
MKYAALLLAAVLSLGCGAAAAETYTVGMIQISNPWARATPKGATIGGGYMTITNKGTDADRLTGGSTPIADRLQVHQMTMDKGVMTMRPVEGGLEIKPGQTVELKPESFHVMLIGLKQPLAMGQHVKATLEFAKAGKVDIEYVVESIGAQGPEGAAPASAGQGAMDPGMGHMNMNQMH